MSWLETESKKATLDYLFLSSQNSYAKTNPKCDDIWKWDLEVIKSWGVEPSLMKLIPS